MGLALAGASCYPHTRPSSSHPPRAQGGVPERERTSHKLKVEALGLFRGCLCLIPSAEASHKIAQTLGGGGRDPPRLGGAAATLAGGCALVWEEPLTVKPSAVRRETETLNVFRLERCM